MVMRGWLEMFEMKKVRNTGYAIVAEVIRTW